MPDYPDPMSPDWTLEAERLIIRPLAAADLDAVYAVMVDGYGPSPKDECALWLNWTVANYQQLALLAQPPYGERGIVLKGSGVLIGMVGLVPSLGPFEMLPSFQAQLATPPSDRYTPEIGLYWALREVYRAQGYATEAARTLIDFAFEALHLKRIVATTDHDNAASIAVMRRLGMTVERYPYAIPAWFQTVGVLVQ